MQPQTLLKAVIDQNQASMPKFYVFVKELQSLGVTTFTFQKETTNKLQ